MKIYTESLQTLGRDSTQIRVRLRPEERLAFEEMRLKDWSSGHAHAETLSSWIRHRIRPLTSFRADLHTSHIPKTLHEDATRMAQIVGEEPDQFIQTCIETILAMIEHSKSKRHSLIEKCRESAQQSQGKTANTSD